MSEFDLWEMEQTFAILDGVIEKEPETDRLKVSTMTGSIDIQSEEIPEA